VHSASCYLCGAVLQFRGASSAVIFIPPPVIRGGKLRGAAQRNTWRRGGRNTLRAAASRRARCAYANDLCAGQPYLMGFFSNTEAQEVRWPDDTMTCPPDSESVRRSSAPRVPRSSVVCFFETGRIDRCVFISV